MIKVYALEFIVVVVISVIWVYLLDKQLHDDTSDTE